MKTWIFEIVGNQATVSLLGAFAGGVVYYRTVRVRRRAGEGLRRAHGRFLDYLAEEVALARAPSAGAYCEVRGPRGDVEWIEKRLRRAY